MPMGIVVISCVRPSVQPSMGLGLCISYKALGRNGLQFGMLMYPDGSLSIHGCLWILLLVCLSVHLSVCSFTAFSGGCAFAEKSLGTNGIKFGAKEGGSHYWEMAVAITCGYGRYLLPLLAAHSSFTWLCICESALCYNLIFYKIFSVSWSSECKICNYKIWLFQEQLFSSQKWLGCICLYKVGIYFVYICSNLKFQLWVCFRCDRAKMMG